MAVFSRTRKAEYGQKGPNLRDSPPLTAFKVSHLFCACANCVAEPPDSTESLGQSVDSSMGLRFTICGMGARMNQTSQGLEGE